MTETAVDRTRARNSATAGRATIEPGDGGLRFWPLRAPAVKRLAAGGAALLAVWSGIGLLYMWLLDDGPVGDADREVNFWLEGRRTARWNSLSSIGSGLSDTIVKVALVAVIGGLMVALWKRWHDAVFLATVVILEASVFVLTSFIVGRERPPVEQLETAAPSGSFPSGHAAAAVAYYVGLLIAVSWHTRHRLVRALLVAVAILAPVVVAVSRTYRGMHHPVDVVAGMALGVASLLVVHWAMEAGVDDIRRDARSGSQSDTSPVPLRVTRLDLVPDESAPSIVIRDTGGPA